MRSRQQHTRGRQEGIHVCCPSFASCVLLRTCCSITATSATLGPTRWLPCCHLHSAYRNCSLATLLGAIPCRWAHILPRQQYEGENSYVKMAVSCRGSLRGVAPKLLSAESFVMLSSLFVASSWWTCTLEVFSAHVGCQGVRWSCVGWAGACRRQQKRQQKRGSRCSTTHWQPETRSPATATASPSWGACPSPPPTRWRSVPAWPPASLLPPAMGAPAPASCPASHTCRGSTVHDGSIPGDLSIVPVRSPLLQPRSKLQPASWGNCCLAQSAP